MSTEIKKAILVVSFGTSFNDTREKTIDVIEDEIAKAYPDFKVYRAWTSGMIINKVNKRDNIHINTVKEAMEQIKADGMEVVIIQPTHLINGIENDLMLADAFAYRDDFKKILYSTPLLTTTEDNEAVLRALKAEHADITDDEALIFMGHGSTHTTNAVYAALDYMCKDLGFDNIHIGTVEGYPELDNVMNLIKDKGYKKLRLAPLMLVAGDHANNDLAGDEEDSWKSILEKEGYTVECVVRGLGEYKGIRDVYLTHLAETMKEL